MKKQKPVYSFGIIFKNEIRCLERCLQSLQPLRDAVPCEVVMADTGSTDGSREIAEKYADILFDFPWCDDFAAARNAVMDRCSGAWYFSIDADEWLSENITELVSFSKAEKGLPRNFGGVVIRNYQSAGLEKDQKYQDFIAVRMARLSTGARYEGCIHESWYAPDRGPLLIMHLRETLLYHDGYVYADKASEKAKHDRNMPLLRKKLAQNPDDIQTLLECIDSSKHHDAYSVDYAQRVVEQVRQKAANWEKVGGVVFRSAVSVAQLHHLPELEEWAEQGLAQFPDSIFVQVDLAYYTFVHYFDDKKYEEAVRWGELYQQGLENYRAGRYDANEDSRGVLEFISPFWERKLSVLMPQVYLELGKPEKALAGIQKVKGSELEDPQQVELCVNMLVRLHRTTMLDAAAVTASFWEQINCLFPDENMAEKRRKEFLRTAAKSFTKRYRDEEVEQDEFLRHGFGVFATLEGICELGTAAAMLDTTATQVLAEKLLTVKEWNELPIVALAHALECGVEFPLPQKPMNIEEMDALASRLSGDGESLVSLLLQTDGEDLSVNIQRLLWVRGLAAAAARAFDWKGSDTAPEQGMNIARIFAETEQKFVPRCYAEDALKEDHICMLPPLHRFGWYCAHAFEALDSGKAAQYVHLLREGLSSCEAMKPMVEFLLESTPELQTAEPSAELMALAQNVRRLLEQFPAGSPAVEEIRNSEAYQKVAHLIEEIEVMAFGGVKQ